MNRMIKAVLCTVVAVLSVACGGGGGGASPTPAPTSDPPPPAPVQFTDVTASSGIAYQAGYANPFGDSGSTLMTILALQDFATSSVASGDYDGDGDVDLFITRGDIGPNLLYRNDGNLVFTDVAAAAGVDHTKSATENYRHSGPAFGDMDGDGDLDLFVGGLFGDPSLIFENNGNGTFTNVTDGSGIDTLAAEHNLSAAFGDYDLDGDIDLLVAHWGIQRSVVNSPDTEHLWRNDTDVTGIRFASVSESALIAPSIVTLNDPLSFEGDLDFTFAPSFAHINDDAYPDIVMAADDNSSQVFLNNQNGTFTNTTDVNVIVDEHGMGSTLGDYDNDGDLDWFVSSIFAAEPPPGPGPSPPSRIGNRLYRNDNGTFVDVTAQTGVAEGGWGWGACFMDFENDGDLDIYHTNGWSSPVWVDMFEQDPSVAFVSDGAGSFKESALELGLADSEQGRGVVCADFDEDGDVDILQLHTGVPVAATLWRNDAAGNNYLRVKLNGLAPNTEASGARITVTIGAAQQMREIVLGNNYLSQNPAVQVFGLGSATQVDEVRVEWPGIGIADTTLPNVQADQTLIVNHP